MHLVSMPALWKYHTALSAQLIPRTLTRHSISEHVSVSYSYRAGANNTERSIQTTGVQLTTAINQNGNIEHIAYPPIITQI